MDKVLLQYWDRDQGKAVTVSTDNPLPGGGEGGSGGPVTWGSIIGKPSAYPPEAHNHDERYYTKTEIDQAGFLLAQPDGETVEIQSGELKAKALTGLQLGVSQINAWLAGTEKNIQEQFNEMKVKLAALVSGINYLGKFETKSDLDRVTNKRNGDLAIVLADETENDTRTMRFWNASLGMWELGGPLSFVDAFIALSDTPNAYENGKLLRSGINGLYFDTPKWSEIDGRPDRTKAQIENAVDAAHNHGNKSAIDRIGIDGQGRITIDDVPYVPAPAPQTKQHLFAYRSGSNQTLAAGTNCVFNTKLSGNITYDTSTGIFTLEAGKTYRVMVEGSVYTSGYVILQLVDAETNSIVNTIARGIWMDVNPSTTSWHESSAGPLKTYVTPTERRGYKIRATSVSGESSLRASYVSLEVEEVGV